MEVRFELGVGLTGLVFFIQGASGLVGEAVDSYLSRSGLVFGAVRATGTVEARDLAVFSIEAALGLVLFVGADAIVQGVRRLRGMPVETRDGAD